VSTSGPDAKLQLDALVDAGVQKRGVFADVTSGSKAAIERPGMKKLLAYVEPGDTVVVWRVHLRSISDGIDPTTTSGCLMLNMLATLAEYERELIVERVNAGIARRDRAEPASAGPRPTARYRRQARDRPGRPHEGTHR
jgi:DNA invertase Pin-like site-specific DNA recombinase